MLKNKFLLLAIGALLAITSASLFTSQISSAVDKLPVQPPKGECETKTPGGTVTNWQCVGLNICVQNGKSREACKAEFDKCFQGGMSGKTEKGCAQQIVEWSHNEGSGGGGGGGEGGGGGGEGGTESEPDTNCKIEGGMGWVLCPVLNTVVTLNDWAFQMIKLFLETPPMLIAGSSDGEDSGAAQGVYPIWSVMRTLANAAFVIVFVLLIYSQITGTGMSNYGIKKMLPKLIIGAILVNLSFWITAAAVDISNIFGRSVYAILDDMSSTTYGDAGSGWGEAPWANLTGNILAGIALGGIAVMAGVSVLAPLALSALFMFIGLIFILTFRNAMVFILVAVSPLALVAYMLPNTEGIYKAWFKLLKVLLMIYPAAAFVMGASTVAGSIVFAAAGDSIIMKLIGVAMPAMGIAAALMLAKTMGSVMQRLGISNPFSGITGAAKDRARKYGQGLDEERMHKRKAKAMAVANDPTKGRARRYLAGIRGGGMSANRQTRQDRAKSDYETQKTIFEEDGGLGGKMAKHQEQMRENRIIASAAEGASKQEDLSKFANMSDKDIEMMAGGSKTMENVLLQQRSAAIMQGAQGMSSQFSSMKTGELEKALVDAIKGVEINGKFTPPDVVKAQAITDQLGRMGGAGANSLANVYSKVDERGLSNNSEQRAYRQMNSAVRSSGVKAKRADVYQHAIDDGIADNPTARLRDITASGSHLKGLSPAELASQQAASIAPAISRGTLSPESINSVLENRTAMAAASSETRTLLQEASAKQRQNASGTIAPTQPSLSKPANPAPTVQQTSSTTINNSVQNTSVNNAVGSAPKTSPSGTTGSATSSGNLTIHRDTTEPPKVSPAQGRTSPPAGTDNYVQRDSGLIVPPSHK